MGSLHIGVSSPSVAAFSGFAAEAKLVRLVSAGASTLHSFNPGDVYARDGIFIGRGVVTIPPLIGPFSMSVGAQSTAQSWHTDPLIPNSLCN